MLAPSYVSQALLNVCMMVAVCGRWVVVVVGQLALPIATNRYQSALDRVRE
jgi:hypothetical protein